MLAPRAATAAADGDLFFLIALEIDLIASRSSCAHIYIYILFTLKIFSISEIEIFDENLFFHSKILPRVIVKQA